MLKPDPTTTNYILYLLVSSVFPRGDVEGKFLEALLNDYTLLLYNAAATSAALLLSFLLYKLLADSYPMLQDSSEDASLR